MDLHPTLGVHYGVKVFGCVLLFWKHDAQLVLRLALSVNNQL